MIKLKETTGSLWGIEYTFNPYLLDWIHGDGKQLIWLSHIDDRPRYYVIRCDSSLTDHKCDAFYDFIQEATSEIFYEGKEFLSDEQLDEFDEKGFITSDRPWPCPPLEMSNGTAWGDYYGCLEMEVSK